jgi:putative membrane protein
MLRKIPWSIGRGFLMGAADIVPGVSGGTVALVLGFYQRLVASIRAGSSALGRLIRFDIAGFRRWLARVEWSFLVPLLVGILLAIIALAGVIERLLHDYPIEMAALFLGLIAGSIVIVWQLLTKRDAKRLGIMVVVGLTVFFLLGLREGTSEETVSQFTEPELWAFFVAGAIAICAMILPGVSGSFLLVMLGMYGPVLGAVNDRDIGTLLVFLIGATVGLALFSQGLHWALREHYDSVMAALIGLMIGSIRVLWPWPDGLNTTSLGAPDRNIASAIVIAVIACAVVLAINGLAKRTEHRTTADEVDELQA